MYKIGTSSRGCVLSSPPIPPLGDVMYNKTTSERSHLRHKCPRVTAKTRYGDGLQVSRPRTCPTCSWTGPGFTRLTEEEKGRKRPEDILTLDPHAAAAPLAQLIRTRGRHTQARTAVWPRLRQLFPAESSSVSPVGDALSSPSHWVSREAAEQESS